MSVSFLLYYGMNLTVSTLLVTAQSSRPKCSARWMACEIHESPCRSHGAGDPDDLWASLARVFAQESFSLSRNLIGLSGVWETTPLLRLSALLVISADDGSLQIQPLLTYSVSDEAEFIAGFAFNIGDRPDDAGLLPILRSEFGSYPHSLFFEFKFYF